MEPEGLSAYRQSLERHVNMERRALAADGLIIQGDAALRDLNERISALADIPADILTLQIEIKRLRRARYIQYLRAYLDEISFDL